MKPKQNWCSVCGGVTRHHWICLRLAQGFTLDEIKQTDPWALIQANERIAMLETQTQ